MIVARVARREMLTGFDVKNAKDGAHLEVLVVERSVILRLIFLFEFSISMKFWGSFCRRRSITFSKRALTRRVARC